MVDSISDLNLEASYKNARVPGFATLKLSRLLLSGLFVSLWSPLPLLLFLTPSFVLFPPFFSLLLVPCPFCCDLFPVYTAATLDTVHHLVDALVLLSYLLLMVMISFYVDVRGLLLHDAQFDSDSDSELSLDMVPLLHARHEDQLRSYSVDDLKLRSQQFVWNHFGLQISTSDFVLFDPASCVIEPSYTPSC